MKARRRYSQKPFPLATIAQSDDSNEGGLDLGQVLAAIRRRILIVVGMTIALATTASLKALKEKPVYQARFEVLVEPATVETQIISSVPGTLSSKQENSPQSALDATKLRILKSPKLLSPVIDKLKERYPGINYGSIVSNLSLSPNNTILEVGYRSPNEKEVRAVLDLVAQSYLNYSLEQRQRDIRQGLEFVEKQLPELQSRVEILQERLQKFRQRYNLIDPETQSQQLSSQISTLTTQRLDNQVKLDEARSIYTNLQKELLLQPSESATASVLSQSSRYQNLLGQIKEIDLQIAKDSTRFSEVNPNIQFLREKRQNLLPLLQQEGQQVQKELAEQIREINSRNQALSQAINRLNGQLEQLPMLARQYSDIQRELKIATDNLNQFLTKREALRIDSAQREVPWQLLTPVTDPEPSSPTFKKNLILGTLLGFLVGLGAALGLDKLINILYFPKELKFITKFPLLGIIPFEREVKKFTYVDKRSSLPKLFYAYLKGFRHKKYTQRHNNRFQETFRSLYTNIHFLSPDISIRSLVISSSAAKEGKSTVAVHLAQTIAAIGQKVLLVDTNLREPSLHDYLGLLSQKGLTDVISKDINFTEVIQRSHLEDNLFIMASGSALSEPLKVIASPKMQDLMEQLQDNFDVVIYDTPSLIGVADISWMAANTNGVLLVVGLGKLKRPLLEQALEELKVSKTPVLGVVANHAIGSWF